MNRMYKLHIEPNRKVYEFSTTLKRHLRLLNSKFTICPHLFQDLGPSCPNHTWDMTISIFLTITKLILSIPKFKQCLQCWHKERYWGNLKLSLNLCFFFFLFSNKEVYDTWYTTMWVWLYHFYFIKWYISSGHASRDCGTLLHVMNKTLRWQCPLYPFVYCYSPIRRHVITLEKNRNPHIQFCL